MKKLQSLFVYVKPYLGKMAIAATALIIATLIGLALPWVLRQLVDSVFVTSDLGQLNRIGLGLLLLFILQAGFSFTQYFLLAQVAQRVVADLRLALQRHLMDLPMRFFNEQRVGELVSRLSNDVTTIQSTLTEAPINLFRQVVTFIGGLTLMILINWQLTILVFIILPPILGLAFFFGKRLERLSTTVQDRLADATSVLEESISGIRVVKSFTQEAGEKNRFRQRIEDTLAVTMRRIKLRSVFIPMINFLAFGGITIMLWFGGRAVIAGETSPGDLIAFLIYAIMVGAPLGEFAGLYSQTREAMGASQRIIEILETPTEPLTMKNAPRLPTIKGQVNFDQVNFGYEADNNVLCNINLEVPPAQMVALVGPSGVGKTTLVNLIPRFFDPTSGRITIDGHEIDEVDLHSLRQQVGLVPQETFLFGGTVRENIAYGRSNASKEEIIEAAKASYAHDFIEELPEKYDSLIGERGAKLSAGQRQRLAIARALLKDPRILILDEATSALDTESERLVQAALERLMQGRTSFIIAHRLSTIQRADRILVLKEGSIIEDGNHKQLLKKKGLYHHLWNLQFNISDPIENTSGKH
jgi:subfamily B ATP-binding cassette protein MsbA